MPLPFAKKLFDIFVFFSYISQSYNHLIITFSYQSLPYSNHQRRTKRQLPISEEQIVDYPPSIGEEQTADHPPLGEKQRPHAPFVRTSTCPRATRPRAPRLCA